MPPTIADANQPATRETRGRGRPPKLNAEVAAKIVDLIRKGNYAETAALAAGITERTFYYWLEWGEQQRRGRYRDFFQSVKSASAEAEIAAVAVVRNSMLGVQLPIGTDGADGALKYGALNWQPAMTWLERRYPKRWGRRIVEHQGSAEKPIKILVVEEEESSGSPSGSPEATPTSTSDA